MVQTSEDFTSSGSRRRPKGPKYAIKDKLGRKIFMGNFVKLAYPTKLWFISLQHKRIERNMDRVGVDTEFLSWYSPVSSKTDFHGNYFNFSRNCKDIFNSFPNRKIGMNPITPHDYFLINLLSFGIGNFWKSKILRNWYQPIRLTNILIDFFSF